MARVARYDLSASNNYLIPFWGKGIVKTGLAIALPPSVYARIAPCSRLAIRNFINVGVEVIDSDYRSKIKVVLFNHFDEDFSVKAGYQIAQLILERIETPKSEK